MKNVIISENDLNTETLLAVSRALTGVAGYYVGKAVSKRVEIDDLSMVGLLVGYAFAPVLIKIILKN